MIREKTFKELTITHAFKKAGIWPIDSSFQESEAQLQHWKVTLPVLLSSPSRQRYNNWVISTETVLAHGQLQELNLSILRRQVDQHKNRGRNSRLRLQIGGALTVDEARALQTEKAERVAEKEAAKEARIARQATNQARKQLKRAGIEARKQERLRKKRVKAYEKAGNPIPPEDQDPIPDPEAESESGSGSGSGSGSEGQFEWDGYENYE
ncbi:hypothetical protein VE00_10732 [Pseudogymnoascus sp. WSF 3629]|nr:hypothetical protein VE00_10732 [Pseudogymnoascus sp. WSF 3629]